MKDGKSIIKVHKYEWYSICAEDGAIASDTLMAALFIKAYIDLPVEGSNKWRLGPRANEYR